MFNSDVEREKQTASCKTSVKNMKRDDSCPQKLSNINPTPSATTAKTKTRKKYMRAIIDKILAPIINSIHKKKRCLADTTTKCPFLNLKKKASNQRQFLYLAKGLFIENKLSDWSS